MIILEIFVDESLKTMPRDFQKCMKPDKHSKFLKKKNVLPDMNDTKTSVPLLRNIPENPLPPCHCINIRIGLPPTHLFCIGKVTKF